MDILEPARAALNGLVNQYRTQFMQELNNLKEVVSKDVLSVDSKIDMAIKQAEGKLNGLIEEKRNIALLDFKNETQNVFAKVDGMITASKNTIDETKKMFVDSVSELKTGIEKKFSDMELQAEKMTNEMKLGIYKYIENGFVPLVEANSDKIVKILIKSFFKNLFKKK